jgi:hypothetical protein
MIRCVSIPTFQLHWPSQIKFSPFSFHRRYLAWTWPVIGLFLYWTDDRDDSYMLTCLLNFHQKGTQKWNRRQHQPIFFFFPGFQLSIKSQRMKLQVTFNVSCNRGAFHKKKQFKPPPARTSFAERLTRISRFICINFVKFCPTVVLEMFPHVSDCFCV